MSVSIPDIVSRLFNSIYGELADWVVVQPIHLVVVVVVVKVVQIVGVDIDVYRNFRQVFAGLATTGFANN